MSHLIPKLNRYTLRVLLVFLFISGILAYSYVDRTVYTTEELVIVPGSVKADGFDGIETVLIQDVDGDGLFQNFTTNNSAYTKPVETNLTPEATVNIMPESDSPESSSSEESATGEASDEEVLPNTEADTESGIPAETSPVEEGQESVVETSTAEQPEQAEETPSPQPAEPVSFKPATELFPWAQFDETISAEDETKAVVEDDVVVEEEAAPIDTPQEVDFLEDTPVIVEEEEVAPDIDNDIDNTESETSEESVLEEIVDENGEDVIVESFEPPATTTEILFGIDPCLEDEGCKTRSLFFDNFTLPEFKSGTVLDTVQLRLSLAAKAKENSALQRFVISYSLDFGQTWLPGTVIDVDGEVSNSINGDHFLMSIDVPKFTKDLSGLQVKVAYEGIEADLERAYVDGLWLEVTSGSFYEASDFASSTDAIDYARDLEGPALNDLVSPDMDVVLGATPEFSFEYQMQQNFFKRIFNSIFSENTFAIKKVTVSHSQYGVVEMPYEVVYHEGQAWTLSLPNSPQKMHPGKYQVSVTIGENEEEYTDTFEFYWGVLALNTTKSMYTSGESVTLNLAALTDEGDTICDADLRLQIVSPDNAFYEVPVSQSGACSDNNVTDIPDYLASFIDTRELGVYQIYLEHRNKDGAVVHKIHDSFEVREFVAYDIERTAPTRIYPPSPYDVKLKITANRTFDGDIVERVPRGFAIDDIEGVRLRTLPDYTEIIWPDISMAEGEVLELTYRFDAPDISPYLYLLGPLDMGGFKELRAWQIASDALSGIGWFTGTSTIAGSNLNAAPSQMQWGTSSVDTYYYEHSTTTNNERVTLRQSGDYFVAITLPQLRTDANGSRSRIGIEVRVNGVVVPASLGQSGYIRNANGQRESSSHSNFLLTNIVADDYIEVYAQGLTTIDAGDVVNVTGLAGMYIEYMASNETVFSATATSTVASSSLNTATSALSWTENRQDSGFVHSDTVSPENITISNPGVYMVQVSVPLAGTVAQQNVLGRVMLDGVQINGGQFAQGYQQSVANENDAESSIHWSGVVVATGTNQVLTITTEQEAAAGTVTVPVGHVGSVFIQKMPATDVFVARGRNLVGGTDWSPAATSSVQWDTELATSTTFTHSTTSNSHQITVTQSGDYLLTFNGAFTQTATGRSNHRISVQVGAVDVNGAQTKSNYIRNQSGHATSSSALTYLLTGVATSSVITVSTMEEGNNATVNDSTDAMLMLWKKSDFNARPDAPSDFDTPFDNIRFASTTPYFDFQSTDSDGSSDLVYEFAISTSSDFATATVRISDTDAGFSNTASTTDTSPFTEAQRIRFQVQGADVLTDLTTYFWRVRAKDVSGSDEFGDWSTTQSLTVDMAATNPYWYQTLDGQFTADTLVGTVSGDGGDHVEVNAAASSEILIAYGEGTVTTPRYRLWDGVAWGTELSAVAGGGTINWVQTAAGVTRDEYALVTLDATSASYAQIYQASTTSWGNQVLVSSGVTGPQYRGVAVGYESLSGDAMVISCSTGPDPVYRIWDGSSWSATSTINASSLNNCNYVEMASDPASDEIIMIVRDTSTQYETLVWDGNAWGNARVLGSSNVVTRQGMAIAYEASGDQAIVVTSNGTGNNFVYSTWNGIEWSINATQAVSNDFSEARLAPDTDSDYINLCYLDINGRTNTYQWDGGVWATSSILTLTSNATVARGFDCEFESAPGRTSYSLTAFSDTVNVKYRTATSSWNWSASTTVDTLEDSYWVQTERADDGIIMVATLDDIVDDFIVSYWNGSAWSTKEVLETSPSSVIAAPYEPIHMSGKRYQFSEGVVITPPISFAFVPSQPTWGDITFESTEPFGTDVRVQVMYTASTTCDTAIPDGTLAGNSTGFTSDDLPIDISAVSTTTYSSVCLKATITTLGSASASLDDWALSWVREPKLNQSAYHWYTNLSALTPTDIWPAGITDVAESTAIDSSIPVNNGDVIRLRIALQSANVALPTTTDAFKLQYAAGASCSPTMSWFDVGGIGSTTALWRGYENSVVGDDWYSGSWERRIKITVDHTLVDADLTDFPVYVNLDDLPTTFFDNVQADGDDIRITSVDGLTELPYELVSINTTSDTGELHFKAAVASTTNTDFYIYYDNPSASGYAVTDTYGRNNVWTNGFEAVYHLQTSPASNMTDSTSNGRTLTTNGGMGAGNSTSSVLGNGVDFDGINDRLTSAGFAWTAVPVTVTMWNNVATAEVQNSNIFGFTAGTPNERLASHAPWSDNNLYWDYGSCCAAPGRLSINYTAYRNKWTHIGLVSQGTSGSFMGIYLDGTPTTTAASSDDPSVTLTGFSLGSDNPSGGNHHNGRIDEFRIASVARTGTWISTEENNQSNPTGFYAVASEEVIGDGQFLTSTLLTNSDNAETYEEYNPTSLNRSALAVDDEAEWDFALEANNVVVNTQYCFRMVYSDGATLASYPVYASLLTNAPPTAPMLSAPFDNEQLASTTPWFEFAATDAATDDVSYEIQVDDDYAFGSLAISRESNANFSDFTNLEDSSERSVYTNGQTIRFVPTTSLTSGVTYYWRVRARDDNGSDTQGEWSVIQSFTVNASTTITTWYQTTAEQFDTNGHDNTVVNTGSSDVRIATALTTGTTTSSVIDYDDRDTGNAWGSISFNHNVTSGSIRYYVQYRTTGENFSLIPDSALTGNSAGFTSSPISLTTVNPETYNEIRIVALLTGNDSLPRLQDWSVTWGLTIEEPVLSVPFDSAKVATTTPTLEFVTSDPENQDLQYEIQFSSTADFAASSTFVSGVDNGFINTEVATDTSSFYSGDVISYTVQSALTNGLTYWWRARAKDPSGSDAWSDYSDPYSFTVDTAVTTSVWYQTTGDQFATGDLTDIETTAGGAQITSVVRGVMAVYGEGTGQSPRYRLFDGTEWGAAQTAASVGAQIRWTKLEASPTRPEYALGTLGTDNDVNVQIYDATTESWGNVVGIESDIVTMTKKGFDVAYETTSGDLLAVTCRGTEAAYAIWDGASWTATSSISLTSSATCDWVELASDPTSDEIVAVFRHTTGGTTDFETYVWSGSGWGNNMATGRMNENGNQGMAVEYEASGGQAVVVMSSNVMTNLIYSTWNGSAWLATSTATSTAVLGDHIEWATLRSDDNSDAIALCYIDNDGNLGVMEWSGSAWGTATEIDQLGNSKAGRPIDCAYETTAGRDNFLMIPYSDNGAGGVGDGGKYQYASTSFSAELDMGTVEDSWFVYTVRAADGTIHTAYLDDTNDRYDIVRWDGVSAWTTREVFSSSPSITGTPFDGSFTMAAQIYPNFTQGAIRSTPIDFDDGTGPRWEQITFSDTTPGASDVLYRLYYLASTSVYTLVPDSALAGNSAGFSTSPVSIATLDRTVYDTLKLDAELICTAGNCPTIQDWSVEWSEGISVSGRAYEYDEVSSTTAGTVGVVVNGVLQAGKTGTIQPDGTWSITNVTAFEGDTVMVYVNSASETDEALAMATYDGVGDVTNMELTKRHLTIGSSDTATTTNAGVVGYDVTDDEDIFVDIAVGGNFDICTEGCADHRLKIKAGALYAPGANILTHDVRNNGTLRLGTSTLRVRGSWNNQGTFVPETSTVIFTATSSSESLTGATSTLGFYNVTFGETAGAATWTPDQSLSITGTFAVDYGTYARATTSISLERDLRIGVLGLMTGLGTTTFAGSGSFTWTDLAASSTNIGYVVIDGTAKTVTLGSVVKAESITIGSDDTLNASGSGFNLQVVKNWTNNNSFVAQSGTVTFVGTTTGTIARGASAFNNLTFNGVGGVWSFSTSTLAVTTNFTIATGTITMPTGTTTIGGSFLNTGGAFAHNNGEIRMTSTAAGRSITTSGTPFLNAFYDLVFSGSGAWTFTQAATTSRDMRISAGVVTLPTTTLTVTGDFAVSGSGSFVHNSGEVILLVASADTLGAGGSAFNNVRVRGGSSTGWYNTSWNYRVGVTVQSSEVTETLADFPIYVNLANLPSSFFTRTQNGGADIRVTTSDGFTEVPYELVTLSTSTSAGELHFKAPTLSSTTNSTFYIYYDNSSASAYASSSTYGRNNVWTNGYEAVYHLGTSPVSTMVDSTANGRDLTAQGGMGAGNSVAGAMGNAIDFDGTDDYLRNTTFAWTANPVTVTAWNNVATAELSNSNMFGFTASGNERNSVHAPYSDSTLYWDYGTCCTAPGRLTTSYASSLDKWTHVALVSQGGSGAFMGIYLDGALVSSSGSSDDPNVTLTSFAIGSFSGAGGSYHNGRVDEFRIASVARSTGWIGTEENNQASTTAFYSAGSAEARTARTFTDTNVSVLGNLMLDVGGDSVFPTGVLSVGGSFDNNALFTSNNGTVRFNSTAGVETIAAGSSTFATLEFNSTTGDFTVTEQATSTVAINLTAASQFTVNSGIALTASGTFSQAASGTATTWTGSILRLLGSDHAMNTKTHTGDTYATIETAGDTDVTLWNSTATSFVTGSTSSIYVQDHNGVDGDLYIYGNYIRTSGTEHWAYATDFDGTALGTSSVRQVDVRIATSSTVGFNNASLNLTGTSSATTTVAAITGGFSLNATGTTITAKYFSVASTGPSGIGLFASSTLSIFEDGYFSVLPGQTAISIDGATVNQNPAKQLERIGFATTTAGAGSNVTYTGTSTSFVWFRTGYGNLYGEAYDSGDANPGMIRFDDSSYLITVAGRVLTGDGSISIPAPTCDGATPNVRLVVNSGSYTASTSCNGTTGAYSFANVAFTGDPVITVYLDTNGGTKGTVITKTPTGNISNLDLYADQITLRHEGAAVMTIADLTTFNYASDTDMLFLATTSPSTLLSVYPTSGLLIASSSTFTPGGDVTLFGNASSSAYEGTLRLATSSQFIAAGTQTHTLSGRLVLGTNATLTTASSTFVFTATTTGKSITASSTITFNNLSFTGASGAWHITAPLSVGGTMTIATGTVTGTSNITLTNGSLLGDGTLSLGSGTTTLERTNTLGGTRPWSFANLVLGNGSVVGTTAPASVATTTVSGRLTISVAHIFTLGSSRLDLSGAGTVFVNNGTFTASTGLVQYSGANASVLPTTYYDLALRTLAGSSTFTGTGAGILVGRDLYIGNGSASTTFDVASSDPVLTVTGSVTIAASSTFSASDVATTTIAGSYDNDGTFRSNNGRVAFTGSGTHTIAAGASAFGYVTINGTGAFTVSESATSSLGLILANHTSFIVTSGTTLAVAGSLDNRLAGGATTWAGTLSLYGGGSMSINASTTSDVYTELAVQTGTRVRMWNSSATTYTTVGGLYSQDHGGTNGLLHIYGTFTETTAADYWSYATDFDGTSLVGGAERQVTVAFASSTVATWTGGSLSVVGTTTASTTLQNQGSGTYSLTIGGTATTNWNLVTFRNLGITGIVFTGTPTVTDFSRTDIMVQINSGTGMTVGGTVINENEAKNFTSNIFTADLGVTGASNVTATGTAVSSWRFTNHAGALSGEAYNIDPTGDPGYLVWDDSAALVTVSGNVYSDEGVTVSANCDGSTNNVVLRVAGLTTYTTFCNATSGAYAIPNVAYNSLDSLVLFIDGETEKAANVTKSPISSINAMHLYENRVIVRHENTDAMTIADMAVWDSSDDADIPFTAVNAGTDTLDLPANTKLLIWTGKTFTPGGNITLAGGGAGASYDGTLEALTNARFQATGSEVHSIGGSFIFGTGATFEAGQSTTTFTTTGAARTIDVNAASFYNTAFTGSGSWTVTDDTFTSLRSLMQSAGTLTFGSATTTIGGSFNATAGNFIMGGSALVFNSSSTGNTIRFDGASVPSISFTGTAGTWTMSDTDATTTGSFSILAAGTVTLPSGTLAIAGSFDNASGTITHNTSELIMSNATAANLRMSGSDLFGLRKTGIGAVTILDGSGTFRDDVLINAGALVSATNTLSVGGSFIVTGGTFDHASGTVLFNATAAGKTITASTSAFYNVNFGSASGGWTISGNATTTNNLTLTTASAFTTTPGTILTVGGVFTNLVGGGATTWSNAVLTLTSTSSYTINSTSSGGDDYATTSVTSADIRAWNSSFATTTLGSLASIYSQDNAAVDGVLTIYGDFRIATTTEYWSYATDFDGAALAGINRRAVTVRMASTSTTTLESGTLNILGAAGATSSVRNITAGTYGMVVTGGTINAQYYSFANIASSGLAFSGTPTITELSYGYYDLAVNGGSLISLASTTLDANASKIFTGIGFGSTLGYTGTNVNLTGSTSNAWRFAGSYGTLGGEAFDNDGIDACGSLRFDDSACLLTSQTAFRWRNDDGGEGAPNSEWYDASFDYRKRVRIENTTATTYATTSVKLTVAYDSAMQSDFDDLRFTDDDGLLPLDFWVEKKTASTEAIVWVEVPAMAADAYTTVFMYFGSSTATSSSNGTNTFLSIDDFEDNNITEYAGDTSIFQTDTTPVYGGTYSLEASNKSARATDGIFRTGLTTSQGQVVRWRQYIDTTAGSGDEACTLFGVQSPGTANNNYAVCLEQFGIDRLSLSRNVIDNDVSGTVLSTSTVTYTTGWYEVYVDWQTSNSIAVYLYNPSGTLVATTTATDSTYTTGGMGFTFWFQNGSWDSFVAYNRGPINAPVYFGAKQTDGGASFVAAENALGSAIPGDTKRLRFGIENTGLTVTGQTYRLQYAAKGVAPSCEAVVSGNFAAVPNQASCGSSPICMQTSTQVADDDSSTDILSNLLGTFSAGRVVESPSNITSALSITQNYYTELEYAITPTINAVDSYCFRVVNDTTPLDYYGEVAELGLQFDPTLGTVSFNNGGPIILTPNATTTIYATSSVTDFNGYADLVAATTTIYRSGVGPSCTTDTNNCYIAVDGGACSFTNCSGNTCILSCTADIYFHADPTDAGAYEGQEWLAYMEVEDVGGGYDFASALGIELFTLRALTVDSAINYGSLSPTENTGTYNPTTTIANTGNVEFDLELEGTDLTNGGSSIIPADQQKFATSTFDYAACITCSLLSSTTPVDLAVGLTKPSAPTPPVETEVYWGIAVPYGIASAAHQGINVFTPVSP